MQNNPIMEQVEINTCARQIQQNLLRILGPGSTPSVGALRPAAATMLADPMLSINLLAAVPNNIGGNVRRIEDPTQKVLHCLAIGAISIHSQLGQEDFEDQPNVRLLGDDDVFIAARITPSLIQVLQDDDIGNFIDETSDVESFLALTEEQRVQLAAIIADPEMKADFMDNLNQNFREAVDDQGLETRDELDYPRDDDDLTDDGDEDRELNPETLRKALVTTIENTRAPNQPNQANQSAVQSANKPGPK